MKASFDLLRATRRNVLGLTQSLSLEQLNYVPSPLRNNLVWNMGHLVVTQQLLCYRLAGLPLNVDEDLIGRYRKGTAPEGPIDAAELARIRHLLVALVDRTERDWEAGRFVDYRPYETSYGVKLDGIEAAIRFNNLHEALHLGTCLSLRTLARHAVSL